MNCAEIRADGIAERYLANELSAPERDEYENHFLECEECHAELDALRLSAEALRQYPPSGRADSGASPVLPFDARQKRASAAGKWAAAAAIAVGLIGAAYFWNSDAPQRGRPETAAIPSPGTPNAGRVPQNGPESGQLPGTGTAPSHVPLDSVLLASLTRYEAPNYEPAVLRAGAGDAAFVGAMRAYQVKNYKEALAALRSLPDRDRNSPRARFFTGACLLLTGDAAGAEPVASAVIASGDSPYLEESYWLRAKARFKSGKFEEGQADLRTLIALKGDWEAKASRLLRQSMEVR